jgi:hypothetical protein
MNFNNNNQRENTSNTISCGDHEVLINRTAVKQNPNKDYKKLLSDRLVQKMMTFREERLESLRNKKNEIIDSLKLEMMGDDLDFLAKEAEMSNYFDYILSLFENYENEDCLYNINTLTYNNKISICPVCHNAVFYYNNRVSCINGCIRFDLPEGAINSYFTLENFIDLYRGSLNQHSAHCLEKIYPVYMDLLGQFMFVCPNCNY